MDYPRSPSRARTVEIPKPEAGLAEWASKIKAMQRQVDTDDEAEQKRLEEEIAASRLARMRRSQGSRGNSVDLTKDKTIISNVERNDVDYTAIASRRRSQDTVTHGLVGGSPYSPAPVVSTNPLTPAIGKLASTSASSPLGSSYNQPKPQSISLAAFMGGQATGPRLNRHAPQQDAHDPTQFRQQATPSAPHPIFGRGGVAMPGMLTKSASAAPSVRPTSSSGRPLEAQHSPAEIDRKTSSSTRSATEEAERQSLPHAKPDIRERTISTPHYTASYPLLNSQPTGLKPSALKKSSSQANLHSSTTVEARAPASVSPLPSLSPRPSVSRHASISPRLSNSPQPTLSSTPPSSKKSSIAVPSLARPIGPDPRISSQAPIIPPSQNPSPAFLRPAAQKEPTPSISRLQGRGFVQTMVKVSTQLESSNVREEGSPSPEKPRTRKTSVLDRWQPAVNSPSPPPPGSPLNALRKSRTDVAARDSTSPENLKLLGSTKTPSERVSLPFASRNDTAAHDSLIERLPPEGAPGLGSATTLMIIKPNKTGDQVLTTSVTGPSVLVDEIGVKRRVGSSSPERKLYSTSELPAQSGNPLIHPTKDRARIQRKSRVKGETVKPHDAVSSSQSAGLGRTDAPLLSSPKRRLSAGNITKPDMTVGIVEANGQLLRSSTTPVIIRPKDTPLVSLDDAEAPAPAPQHKAISLVGRRALPGLAAPDAASRPASFISDSVDTSSVTPSSVHAKPAWATSKPIGLPLPGLAAVKELPTSTSEKSPTGPGKHVRIPSTGNRATVMDVAYALNSRPDSQEKPNSAKPIPEPVEVVETVQVKNAAVVTPAIVQAQKRKSSYDRYSAITLPPVVEERISTPSPVEDALPTTDGETMSEEHIKDAREELSVPSPTAEAAANRNTLNFEHADKSLPKVDIKSILTRSESTSAGEQGVQTISVDVMTVKGSTATAIPIGQPVFYDTEVLAVIHRFRRNGLVSTNVHGWRGKRSQWGDRELRKLNDLAAQYRTSLETIEQSYEPLEFVRVIGKRLVIRQGVRSHWSPENTALHLVRAVNDVVYIDEHDLNVKNLCSGYAYCITILDTVYVWYGCGSRAAERQVAKEYAQALAENGNKIIELTEGENDEDEMFWMVLGDDNFANADYWKWRRTAEEINPRIWRTSGSGGASNVQEVSWLSKETNLQQSVYVIDCIWEYYILVGRDARGHRDDIRLAVHLASNLSAHVAPSRPYPPTVHVLIIPTQLPRDLQLHFRDVDESYINEGQVPDHMNILTYDMATTHLNKITWEKVDLADHSMLPLGLNSSDIP